MSSTYAEPFDRLEACLDEVTAIDPTYRTAREKQEALTRLSTLIARAQAERLRVLAVADDVAEATGARSAAAWVAAETRDAPGRLRADARLAEALDDRWGTLQRAFRAGLVNLAQVRVIDKALTDLPADLAPGLLAKAEALLVEEAADHGPRELAVLGARILERLAPHIAEQAEYAALLAAEQRADATTRLTMRRRGDGSTDVHARIPDLAASMLRTYLAAFANPRREPDREEPASLPAERKQGIAFVALLERVLAKDLPRHGGKATTVAVVIDHGQLRADLHEVGVAHTTTGDRLTAGEARRLACSAGILPAVLGGRSEVLDLARVARLFNAAQRRAMEIRDKTCTETGCTMPAAFCHAHHKQPWAQGGRTDLADGTLLCPFHHRRAHDPRWTATYHADGSTRFHRRQ